MPTAVAVRPVDAAGLVLLRGDRDDPEVLLGRRHAAAGFLPGIYVFPGGRVEDEDAYGPPLHLARGVVAGLSRASRRPAEAFVRAALRETEEEAGLTVPRGMIPRIDFICRAITPTRSRRRYNTRFLLSDGGECAGELGGDGELEDLAWRKLSEIEGLGLVDVTEFVFREATRRWRSKVEAGREPAPRFSYAGNAVRIRRGT